MIKNAQVTGFGVDPQEYHRSNGKRGEPGFVMSPSHLKKFAENPSEWIYTGARLEQLRRKLAMEEDYAERNYLKGRIRELDGPTQAQQWGQIVDCLALTPDLFDKRFIQTPAEYETDVLKCPRCGSVTESTTCRKCKTERLVARIKKEWSAQAAECQQWKIDAEREGLTVLSTHQYEEAREAVARLMSKPECKKAIECSDKQVHVSGEWHDKATGIVVPIQCLIDLRPRLDTEFIPGVDIDWPRLLGDLKTSMTLNRDKFIRRVVQFGWHTQGAFDLDLYKAATSEDRTNWFLIGQKNYGTYEPFRKLLSEKFVSHGGATYKRLMANYCQCLKHNKWPDADDTPSNLCGFDLLEINPYDELAAATGEFYSFDEETEGSEEADNETSDDLVP